MDKVEEVFPVQPWHYEYPNGDEFLCGTEYEIEDIKNIPNVVHEKFEVEEDHSLRNNGREFKTYPLPFNKSLEYFDILHKNLKLGKEPFTDRCSIHVHVNARKLNMVQLRALILGYALVEPLFFEYVGDVRKNSIFCVPLNYTYLPSVYLRTALSMHGNWHKYTAFNILPLKGLGTVEFRHMYATGDITRYKLWLEALRDVYNFAKSEQEPSVLSMLNNMSVAQIARTIVPTFADQYANPTIENLLADTVLDVKLSGGGLNTKKDI